jgi:hypothetical protein
LTRTVIDAARRIRVSAVSPQTVGSTAYAFSSWSSGGAQTHTISAPAVDDDLHATFTAGAGTPSSLDRRVLVRTRASEPTLADRLRPRPQRHDSRRSLVARPAANGGALSFDGGQRHGHRRGTTRDLTNAITLEALGAPEHDNRWRTVALKEQSVALSTRFTLTRTTAASGARHEPLARLGRGRGAERILAAGRTPGRTCRDLHDGAVIRLYVNGTLSGSTAATGSIARVNGGVPDRRQHDLVRVSSAA